MALSVGVGVGGAIVATRLLALRRWSLVSSLAARSEAGQAVASVEAELGPPDRRTSAPFRDTRRGQRYELLVYVGSRWLGGARPPEIHLHCVDGYVVKVESVPSEPMSFESRDWRTATAARRRLMVRDLLGRDLLRGETRESVAAILGAPEAGVRIAGWDAAYALGSDPDDWLGTDQMWLVILYDRQGHFQAAAVKSD